MLDASRVFCSLRRVWAVPCIQQLGAAVGGRLVTFKLRSRVESNPSEVSSEGISMIRGSKQGRDAEVHRGPGIVRVMRHGW